MNAILSKDGTRTVAQAILDTLLAHDLHHIFALPGSTSAALLDALSSCPEMNFVLTKHESAAIAMAEGHARATDGVGIAHIYNVAGAANAVSMLYNARKNRTPLVVIASQSHTSLRGLDGAVDGDITATVRDVALSATEVTRPERAGAALADAIRTAGSLPEPGPVVLSFPMDVLAAPAPRDAPVHRTAAIRTLSVAKSECEAAAEMVRRARRPLIISGSQVGRFSAQSAVESLAEVMGAPLAHEHWFNDHLGFSPSHPHAIGDLHPDHPWVHRADLVIALGCRLHHDLHPPPRPWLPEHIDLIHVHTESAPIGHRVPAKLGIMADPGVFAARLAEMLRGDPPTDAQDRSQRLRQHAERRRALIDASLSHSDSDSLHAGQVVRTLRAQLPPETAYFSELNTYQRSLPLYHGFEDPTRYQADCGACLGWSMGAAAGWATRHRDDLTVCCLGDGSFLFGLQTLWTITQQDLPVLVVVFNNDGYYSTQFFTEQMGKKRGHSGTYRGEEPHASLCIPTLAAGFGARSTRCESVDALKAAIEEAHRDRRPSVVEVPVGRDSILLSKHLPQFFVTEADAIPH